MTVPMKAPIAPSGDIIEQVLLKGDLAKLTPDERVSYYKAVCQSIGLNPLTKPFEYITLNGKLQLYALRACTDQLRKINGISLEIVSKEISDGILSVHVRAKDAAGRVDEDLGAVPFPEALRGEARANMELKAVTKAKRRATLSICGLGWLDETEGADIPSNGKRSPPAPAPNVMNEPAEPPPHDPHTGEIIEPGQATPFDTPPPKTTTQPVGIDVKDMAREAAQRGREVMRQFYMSRSKAEKTEIDKIRAEINELVDAAEAGAESNDQGS